jgi:serine/threonine-protein kinase
VSRGLAKAHAAGVVHRDLKPANIFLTTREDGSLLAKVVDFGISKFVNEERPKTSWRPPAPEKRKLTRVGGVIGTPQYMSPEQARGLPNVSHRSDVWSLAAVLYEALAGRPAYEEQESYEDMLIAIVTTDPPPLTEIAPWVPAELAAVVARCLVKDPLTRMADCVALQQALLTAVPNLQPEPGNMLPVAMSEASLAAAVPLLPEVKPSRALTMSGVSNTQRDSAAPKINAKNAVNSVLPGSMHGASKKLVRASLFAFTGLCIVGALALGRIAGRSDRVEVQAPAATALAAPAALPAPPPPAVATAPSAPVAAAPPSASAAPPVVPPSASVATAAAPPAARPKHAPTPRAPAPAAKPADPPAHKVGDIKVSDQY